MSWMARLYETYQQALTWELAEGEGKLLPISHTLQNAHINIVIDGEGNFKRASVLEKTQVILPATESSAGRTAGEAAHPLADKLQYVAADYSSHGGRKESYFTSYEAQLSAWCESEFTHPKAQAIHRYIKKGKVISDLIAAKIVYVDDSKQLLTTWIGEVTAENPLPLLFKVLPKEKGMLDQGNALVCWSVELENEPRSDTWTDESLHQSWIAFDAKNNIEQDQLCFVTGLVQPIASNHPAKLRHTGDKAKLVSANDKDGFTFRGRFTNSNEANSIAYEVTQKAHNALRWLISRQAFRNGDQAIVAWAISGKPIPNPLMDFQSLNLDDFDEIEPTATPEIQAIDHSRDLGQSFASALQRYIRGYRAKLNPTENIVVMAIDSATPGRMAITYYRDFFAKDYLDRIEQWHSQLAWWQRVVKEIPQNHGKKPKSIVRWLVSAPAPWSIITTAHSDTIRSNEKLKNNLYERLLPCIIEGRALPLDLVKLCVRHACNPLSGEHWEWERNLGVACAMFRGYSNRHPIPSQRKDYAMSLEINNTSRDYLYGRLLAIAERIEEIALNVAGENRPTNAMRLMQRFADRPYSTWLTLYKQLQPYMQRLQNSRTGFLVNCKKELDEVTSLFSSQDFTNDKRLSGEFLLAYHCQRLALRHKSDTEQV